jgi:hypothetical protein
MALDIKALVDQEYGKFLLLKKSGQLSKDSDLNWFYLALREAGSEGDGNWSFQTIATQLRVSRGSVYHYVGRGLDKAPFEKVIKLAELSGFSLDQLARASNGAAKTGRLADSKPGVNES